MSVRGNENMSLQDLSGSRISNQFVICTCWIKQSIHLGLPLKLIFYWLMVYSTKCLGLFCGGVSLVFYTVCCPCLCWLLCSLCLNLKAIVHPKVKIHSISSDPCADVRMAEDLQFTKHSWSFIQYNWSEWWPLLKCKKKRTQNKHKMSKSCLCGVIQVSVSHNIKI